jgi:N-methylhydantoinase A/acetophenone carboxylase
MGIRVGIDTGGTFTDAFVSDGDGRIATVKVETTPHDLTVCFADAIRASADALETPLDVFLQQAEIIRLLVAHGARLTDTDGAGKSVTASIGGAWVEAVVRQVDARPK